MNEISTLDVWGNSVPVANLDPSAVSYLRGLPEQLPAVEWVWSEMDRIWDELGLDNRKPISEQNVAAFYTHPVWLMNGLFTAVDPTSRAHRESIAEFMEQAGVRAVADFGGGSGQLARMIATRRTRIEVDVIEPFSVGHHPSIANDRVNFVRELGVDYDAVLAQDVLEHVEDPVGLSFQLAHSCRSSGLLLFANCFYPVIKCHLPQTFHLRHSFARVMQAMGLDYLGQVPGVEHALVFRRGASLDLMAARRAERYSRRFRRLYDGLTGSIRQGLAGFGRR